VRRREAKHRICDWLNLARLFAVQPITTISAWFAIPIVRIKFHAKGPLWHANQGGRIREYSSTGPQACPEAHDIERSLLQSVQ
jgi:hypothetical protein